MTRGSRQDRRRSPRRLPAALGIALAAVLAGCASQGSAPAGYGSGPVPALEQHGEIAPDPVILSAASGQPVPVEQWRRQLREAPVVLLGEVHDNRRQHELRARLLRVWAEAPVIPTGTAGPGRNTPRPAIVFEFFDRNRRAGLFELTDRPPADRPSLDALLDAAGFNREGWGWPAHEPVFAAARDVDASWIAAGVFRPMTAARGSPTVVDAAERARLDAITAAADWSESATATLDKALREGHCGRLPERALPAMAAFQRNRDASLAEPALDAAPGRRTLILSGNGHVGRSHGVPRYLGARAAAAISVGFVEREPGEPRTPTVLERADYDWIVVTDPVADRDDPCASFNPPAPKQTPER